MAKLPVAPDQWPAFSQLLCEALDLPLERRALWLESLTPDLAHFLPGLAKVLSSAALPDASQYLSRLSIPVELNSEFAPGQHVGAYRLDRLLGCGGMSEVWLASRTDGMLPRQIALKLLYALQVAGGLRQRFEHERDILAVLSHPHVTTLYDAGVSPAGQPYLALEWIDGIPITRYCAQKRLSLKGRLDLFGQALEAVHYAHSHRIAHRDLKPSNLLVTKKGHAKLLDFGIAQSLGAGIDGRASKLPQLEQRAATPGYAAPEQIRGEPITSAVDIYAMGVLLFEILTGDRLFAVARSGSENPESVPLASQRVTEKAARRVGGLSAAQLRRVLQGDLDGIVAKALERRPEHRHRSAEVFADALADFLRQKSISARRLGQRM